MTLVYRIEGKNERPICTLPTEKVHPGAIERWDKVPGYRPNNLRDYFRCIGDPRANG